MTFHPRMAYDATFHRSTRELEDEGPPFAYTPENRARFDAILTRYPPDRRRSAVLPALYLVQRQQGYITGRAEQQVEEFIVEEVEPVRRRYPHLLGQRSDPRV